MITPELIATCLIAAFTVAPELTQQPFYLLRASELGSVAPESTCLGWAQNASTTNYAIADALGSRWEGPGAIIVLDENAIAVNAQPGQFAPCVLNVLAHEIPHVLPPAKPMQASPPTPQMVALHKWQLSEELSLPYLGPGSDESHDDRFIRRCVHVYARAKAAGYDIPIRQLLGVEGFHIEPYLPILVGECLRMRDATFAEIDATPPPPALLDQFAHDVDYHHRLFNRISEP